MYFANWSKGAVNFAFPRKHTISYHFTNNYYRNLFWVSAHRCI